MSKVICASGMSSFSSRLPMLYITCGLPSRFFTTSVMLVNGFAAAAPVPGDLGDLDLDGES
eukprot:CAMPEP_0184228646 /NCGR_PEP_ID=MMETSP0976-20121227/21864_1 /TAXON_ID=483370 /ORGANISM="non described non described, Strain CCMP2097" /LENGTH=60 /DNA_ID=CAMNT_0026533611 /DNA_START=382 /DNA_END=564 /DNA_ORIENTATION=-